MKHPPAAGAGLATAGASLPSVHVGGRIAAAAPLTGSVANPAGCRCAPPGGGAPGRRREGEGSQPRAGRPTRVELERGMLADCRYQPSRRRSVVVKQGVFAPLRSLERRGRGSGAALWKPSLPRTVTSLKSFAGSSCWRATAWGRGQELAKARCSRPGRPGFRGCPSQSLSQPFQNIHTEWMIWPLIALPLLSSFPPLFLSSQAFLKSVPLSTNP